MVADGRDIDVAMLLGASKPHRPLQEGIAFAKHLGSSVRIFEVVVEFVPSHQLGIRVNTREFGGHTPRLGDRDVAVQSAVEEQHGP